MKKILITISFIFYFLSNCSREIQSKPSSDAYKLNIYKQVSTPYPKGLFNTELYEVAESPKNLLFGNFIDGLLGLYTKSDKLSGEVFVSWNGEDNYTKSGTRITFKNSVTSKYYQLLKTLKPTTNQWYYNSEHKVFIHILLYPENIAIVAMPEVKLIVENRNGTLIWGTAKFELQNDELIYFADKDQTVKFSKSEPPD